MTALYLDNRAPKTTPLPWLGSLRRAPETSKLPPLAQRNYGITGLSAQPLYHADEGMSMSFAISIVGQMLAVVL
jgi:hypothetical protein